MDLQTEDKSNKALTVGSLNVLGGIKSDALTAIHTHLQTQDGVQSRIIADMQKLHESISADGVITANEKQMLKKELFIIESEYPLIITKSEATKKSKTDIEAYKEAFQKLQHYIYSELKVFDSMQTALEIERNTFNAFFAAYYSSRSLLQITQDESTKFLPSLEVQGDYENQIGTFQGRLYRWTAGKWELLNAVMPLNPVAHYDMADVQLKTIFQHGYLESTGWYLAKRLCDLSAYKGKKIRVTVSGYRKGDGGYPRLYIYDPSWESGWESGTALDSDSEVTYQATMTIPTEYERILCTLWHYPNDKKNNTIVMTHLSIETLDGQPLVDSSGKNNHAIVAGNVSTVSDNTVGAAFSFDRGFITRAPLECIGVGKSWAHSRWVKLDEYDKEEYAYLYSYGYFDWCSLRDGTVSTQRNNAASCTLSFDPSSLVGKWTHIVVQTQVTATYCKKELYINGKLVARKEANGNFRDITNQPHTDMTYGGGYVRGSLANLLFFDRLLTEQEILYLYLNPQYPVKNYTLADWAIDPANPDSSIKNLTPKYLGVTETVPATRMVVIMKGEQLGAQDAHAGDWVLMGKTVGGWKVGVCYRWSGSQWINLEPEYNYTEQYQAALYHICEIEELMQNTGHFGALFAKVLVAQQAFIDKLVAQEAFINQLATEQAFLQQLIVQQLKIDSDQNSHQDFEAWFDQAHGLKINNKGEEIFKVDIAGNIFAKNATLIDAYFSGNIVSGPLELLNSEPSTQKITLVSNSTATSIVEKYGVIDIICENINGGTPVHRFITMAIPFTTRVPIYEWDYSLIPPKMVFKEWKIVSGVTNTVQFFTNSGDKTYTNNETITEDYILSSKKGVKTFKLKNIPTVKPVDKNIVWVDSSGCLRLS